MFPNDTSVIQIAFVSANKFFVNVSCKLSNLKSEVGLHSSRNLISYRQSYVPDKGGIYCNSWSASATKILTRAPPHKDINRPDNDGQAFGSPRLPFPRARDNTFYTFYARGALDILSEKPPSTP